ncbi:hypothetical protein PZH32_13660, partial [Adlercreutzia equolifaciens]|uniref:hypothetical protein n=1 Tax=Adlercreutzia equolifaciens TaxID=446660 RepID=UPI0023B13477
STVTKLYFTLLEIKCVAGDADDVELPEGGIELTDDVENLSPKPDYYITHTTDFANPPSDPQMTYKEVTANESFEYEPAAGSQEEKDMAEKKALEQKL